MHGYEYEYDYRWSEIENVHREGSNGKIGEE